VVSLVGSVDTWQRRHAVLGFPVAVVRKFSDDSAASLAALLSYYAFVATFPLLLVLVTILEFALRGDPDLQQRLLDSALSEFPIVGDQLRDNLGSLSGSGVTLAVGLVVALIGARGVAATFQRVCNKLWGIPYVHRPSFARSAIRTVAILALLITGAVIGAAAVTAVSAFSLGAGTRALSLALAYAVTAALFVGVFRIATASQVRTRDLLPGALASALVWQLLLGVGSALVGHQLRNASALYGVFGVVLGLLAWFVIQATATLYAIECDVVRVKGLWPRGLTAPRTEADELALAAYARGQQRDVTQEIHVRFDP